MNRKDILDVLIEFMLNSSVDEGSILFQKALDAVIAIQLKQIED